MATITDGTVKWELRLINDLDINPTNKNISVTASKQSLIDIGGNLRKYSGTSEFTHPGIGGGDYGTTYYYNRISPTIAAGTKTLQSLLQELVNYAHKHQLGSQNYRYNCECNCGDSDSCIMSGNILTVDGYKDIKELAIGDCIIGYDGKAHKVVGIKNSKLGSRKAVSISHYPAVFTDDHLYMLKDGYGSYDVDGYYREAGRELTDGNVYGTYARLDEKDVVDVSNGRFSFMLNKGVMQAEMKVWKNYSADAITYTPIVEDCEWCIVDGLVAACARYTK